MLQIVKELKHFFLDSLFPYRCLICTVESDVLCNSCTSKLPRLNQQYCLHCGKVNFSGLTHSECEASLGVDGTISIFSYKDVNDIIITGKYNFVSRVFDIFGQIVADFLLAYGFKANFKDFIVTELPLSRSRLRWRGFNQSRILASAVASRLQLPHKELLYRKGHTKSQKDLNREDRKQNVIDKFRLHAGAYVKGKNVLLVDDVVTTGSTLIEAAKVLKKNGAAQVWCLTVAKD